MYPWNPGSPPLSLSKSDLLSILKGAALAGAGAAGVYAITKLQPALDLNSTSGAVLGALFAVALNLFRKWLTDTRE